MEIGGEGVEGLGPAGAVGVPVELLVIGEIGDDVFKFVFKGVFLFVVDVDVFVADVEDEGVMVVVVFNFGDWLGGAVSCDGDVDGIGA